MTEIVSWIYGLWSWVWFKLNFGSLENPITEGLLSEVPLTQVKGSTLWRLLTPSAAPRYLAISVASLH